jgi:hypothetical protein
VLLVVGALLGDPPAEEPTTGAATEATETETTQARAQGTRAPAETKPEAPGTGTPVRDIKFEFTVNRVECGKSRVGSSDFGQTAQGQFCFVYMKVENIGTEAQTLGAWCPMAFSPGR